MVSNLFPRLPAWIIRNASYFAHAWRQAMVCIVRDVHLMLSLHHCILNPPFTDMELEWTPCTYFPKWIQNLKRDELIEFYVLYLIGNQSLQTSKITSTKIFIPSSKTLIPTFSSTSELVVAQCISSSLFTSHVTLPIPTPTITQTSSLVSIENVTSSFTESVDEFEEDNVVPLGDYFYSKSSKAVLRKWKQRSKYQGIF